MADRPSMQFNFGENWAQYSDHAITPERLEQARKEFAELLAGIELQGRTFLDIGFGQGFSLLSAAELGARVVGCDINPVCGEVLERNRRHFPRVRAPIDAVIGSILDPGLIGRLQAHPAFGDQGFDVVHSWGVLHHTGDMRTAIANAARLVRPGGHFVIAIYNRHWSSPSWRVIKKLYCYAPRPLQKLMVGTLYPVIWLAKLLVTGKNPKDKERGMDFYYDVVDWVGGYPYEYASSEELAAMCKPMGFSLIQARSAVVPTGCNELIFEKRPVG
jgi:SAM-dependent methyltransferase